MGLALPRAAGLRVCGLMAIDPHSPPAADIRPLEDFRTGIGTGGPRSWASLGFLVTALLLFVAYNLLPGFLETAGWTVWPDLWNQAQDLKSWDARGAVVVAAFLSFSFLILVSPFLGSVWRKSGWALWGTLIFSGLSGATFWLMYCIGIMGDHDASPPGAGGWCLMAAPLFNFLGLLLVGPRVNRSHGPDQVGPDNR